LLIIWKKKGISRKESKSQKPNIFQIVKQIFL